MPILTVCPNCRTPVRAPDSAAGRRVRCPGCNTAVPVPATTVAAVGPSPLLVATAPLSFTDPEPPTAVPPPRGGDAGTMSLIASFVALLCSLATVALIYFRPPPDASPSENPLGHGLSHYNFSTPKDALISNAQIELNHDRLARDEMHLLRNGARLQEFLKSIEVRRERNYKHYKVLFISYQAEGVKVYACEIFEKHQKSGRWLPTYKLGMFDLEKEDPLLGEEMKAWREKGELK